MLEWRSQVQGPRTNRPRRTTTSFTRTRRSLRASEARGRGAVGGTGRRVGEVLGGEPLEWGRLANDTPPKLLTHDRYGERIDEIEFHPAWDSLLRLGLEARLQSLPWGRRATRCPCRACGALHAAGAVEAGVGCPLSMTFAAVPALRAQLDLAEEWIPRLDERRSALRDGDDRTPGWLRRPRKRDDRAPRRRRLVPRRPQVVLLGADVGCVPRARAGTRRAVLLSLPRARRRKLPDRPAEGQARQPLQRLAEIALDGRAAQLVGKRAAASHTILEMVAHTRLDCVLGSTALMRRAVAEATDHAAHRPAFGRLLAEQPLMRNVLADLVRRVGGCDGARAAAGAGIRRGDDAPFRRLATPVAKFWICKRTPTLVAEALECLGGNGYVEESRLPRLFRESPLNSIWEGSGNVNALDVLRALAREPESAEAFLTEVRLAEGVDSRLDAAVARLERELAEPDEEGARRLLELLAVSLQGSSSFATARRRSPTRSAPRGSSDREASSARFPRHSTSKRSSNATGRVSEGLPSVTPGYSPGVAVEIQYCPV